MIITRITIICDGPNCPFTFEYLDTTRVVVISSARRDGWTINRKGHGKDYCPQCTKEKNW